MNISRRDFFKFASVATASFALSNFAETATALSKAPVIGSKEVSANTAGSKATVYFTKKIDSEHLIKLYDLLTNSPRLKPGDSAILNRCFKAKSYSVSCMDRCPNPI